MWELLEEGRVIQKFDSYTKAKNALHWARENVRDNGICHIDYKIRKVE